MVTDDLNWLVLQVFQPYFYYALVLSLALFISVNVAVRFTRIRNHRLRSYLFALPMLSPLIVYLIYPPQLEIHVVEGFAPFPFQPGPISFAHVPAGPPMQDLFSVTGTIVVSGLVLGLSLLVLSLALSRFGTRRGLVPISEEDYPEVLDIVARRCKRLKVAQPHVCLVEDLRPNAFVGGHGRSAVLAFSLGMLLTFDEDELTVAIDHELMHLKDRDMLFRSVSIGLAALSFFNPIAYLSYSAAMREREHLADEGSTRSQRSREALRSALRKASSTSIRIEGLASMNGLRLLGMLPLFPRNMLATHPAEEERLKSISRSNRERRTSKSSICLALLCVLLLSAVLLTVFVDTRNILVDSTLREDMLFGAGHPAFNGHLSPFNASPVSHWGVPDNASFPPPSELQNRTDLPAAHFIWISGQSVATIATSN